MTKVFAAAAVVLVTALVAGPVGAATQTVDATLGNTVSMDTSPTAEISGWTLASTGSNTTSGGSMAISANSPYTVTVTGDKSLLSEYDTVAEDYVVDGKTLSSALSVISSRTGGTAPVPGIAATAVVGTSSTLATGTGLGTDEYSLTLSQPTLITDEALESGHTYHIVLTYTASSTL